MRRSYQARKPSRKDCASEVSIAGSDTMGKSGPTDAEIRQRAYAIHLSRRGAQSDPVADWLQAEQELRATAAGLPVEGRP